VGPGWLLRFWRPELIIVKDTPASATTAPTTPATMFGFS
jgi:hypothetical protein